MVKIYLSFKENPEELKLWNYVRSKRNFSVYIKDLIERDMKEQERKEGKDYDR